MHRFPLYSEAVGNESKFIVPTQFSHNLTISYGVQEGRYNFSFECRNFTNEKLYDNFSLQKAGRAFYGKVRVYLSGGQGEKGRDEERKVGLVSCGMSMCCYFEYEVIVLKTMFI